MTKVFLAVATALMLSAGIAHADSDTDQAFLRVLTKYGLSCANFDNCHGLGNAGLIQVGHTICADLRNGRSRDDEFAGLMKSNLTSDHGEALMALSVAAYCPEYTHIFSD